MELVLSWSYKRKRERQAATQAAVFQHLPYELILCVFAYLTTSNGPRNLARCALVCRTWERVSREPALWKSILWMRHPAHELALGVRHVDPSSLAHREIVRLLETCCACGGRRDGGSREYPFWDANGEELEDAEPATLCSACASKESGQVITKTEARKAYALTDADIAPLPHIEVNNPHYRRASSMKLYVAKFVEEAAHRKHGGGDGLQEKLDRNRKAAEKRRETVAKTVAEADARKEQECDAREDQLIAALAARGLKLRDDSRLCNEFIASGRPDIDYVVDVMEEMSFLFAHTTYAQQVERIKDDARRQGERWVHDWVSADAKRIALGEWIGDQRRMGTPDNLIREMMPATLRDHVQTANEQRRQKRRRNKKKRRLDAVAPSEE